MSQALPGFETATHDLRPTQPFLYGDLLNDTHQTQDRKPILSHRTHCSGYFNRYVFLPGKVQLLRITIKYGVSFITLKQKQKLEKF